MRNIFYFPFELFIVCFFLFSCSSTPSTREYAELNYKAGNYDKLEVYLANENEDGDKIDLLIDEAMIKFIKGEYKESLSLFNNAYKQMELLTGEMSLGDKIIAGVSTEDSVKYSGPAYEYSLVDSMSACSFIRLGDLNSARAMMRRSLNNNKAAFNELKARQKKMEDESNAYIMSDSAVSALEAFELAGEDIPVNKLLKSSKVPDISSEYNLSPFIFYLGSLLFANDNDFNMAKDWIINIAPNLNSNVVNSIINIPEGKGSINVVSLADNIVRRIENVSNIPIFEDEFGIRMNFKLTSPVVPQSYNVVKDVYVSVKKANDNHDNIVKRERSIIVEDFDEAVRADVALKANGSYNRSLIRNIIKKSTAYAVGIAAINATIDIVSEQDVPFGFLIVQHEILALQASIIAMDSEEHADTRQGVFFPSKARAAGIILDPGIYDVIVDYVDARGNIVFSDTIPSIEVKEGLPSVASSSFINTGNFITNSNL